MANAVVIDSGNCNFYQMPLSWIAAIEILSNDAVIRNFYQMPLSMTAAFDKNSIVAFMDSDITHYFGH